MRCAALKKYLMKKLLTVCGLLALFSSSAQTLFTYGNDAVPATEFLRAYKKNNTAAGNEKALRDYLDLYIAARLKVKEAKALGLDTLAQLKSDLAALRQQILPTYINDKESLDKLVLEAFTRQQKDIRAAHIFIAFTRNGVFDTAAAQKRRDDALAQLAQGVAFEKVAKNFSDDPSALTNGGDLGWVTAFTLPYEIESVLYAAPQGKLAPVYASRSGYHLLKNAGERKALGRMKAAQILLAFPPGATENYKTALKRRADSLYARLVAGQDFGKLATQFSNDVVSSVSNGQMTEFGVGEFDPAFEAAAFGLVKDGAISKPFQTAHGIHIVKRLKLTPVPAKATDDELDAVRRRIENSDRSQINKKALAKKVVQEIGYKTLLSSPGQLWAYSDSVLNGVRPASPLSIQSSTPVLAIGDHSSTVNDWMSYVQMNRYRANGTGVKPYQQLWDEFTEAAALRYYEEHLEDFNDAFRYQIAEFAEGNLFFEIMQRQVWTPAQTDSVALKQYYQQHKQTYLWPQSADAVLFYAADAESGAEVHKALRKNAADWKKIVAAYSEKITSDAGRFEFPQIPKTAKETITPGTLTAPVVNKEDNTASFAYIIKTYPAGQPRSFEEAKGLVINDYQAALEKQWVEELKKKYPVKIDENVWRELVKNYDK
jgi:peptidyl-prolyl cis-trans isomerase SurA